MERLHRGALTVRSDWGSGFLGGKGLGTGDRVGICAEQAGRALGNDLGNRRNGGGQRGDGLIGFRKIKGGGEIADGGATPGAEVRDFGAKTRLEKSQHGGVVEEIG